MRGVAAEPGGQRQRLDPGRDVGGRVGVQGAAAALVAGVEGGEQLDHLAAAHLADHQPVGSHPQRLPDQVAQGDLAGTLDVGRPRLERDDVRMRRSQLGGVLDQHQPLAGLDQRQQRGEQGGLAASRCRR